MEAELGYAREAAELRWVQGGAKLAEGVFVEGEFGVKSLGLAG